MEPEMGGGVIFDLDGTLVDTNYLHVLAWSRSFADAGMHVPMWSIHRVIGMSSQRLLEELLGHPHEEVSEGHGRHFRGLLGDMKATPGAGELLTEVHRRGATVAVATSAKEQDLEAMLATIAVPEGTIDCVVHGAEVERSKPAPDIFEMALERAGLRADDAVAVGDTTWDVVAAGRSRLPCVALLTGGIAADELTAAGAAAVYKDPADLLGQLSTSPLARLLDQPRRR
jgi:phosphoglycolate phosphatase-like HAD superfamily hydrolase